MPPEVESLGDGKSAFDEFDSEAAPAASSVPSPPAPPVSRPQLEGPEEGAPSPGFVALAQRTAQSVPNESEPSRKLDEEFLALRVRIVNNVTGPSTSAAYVSPPGLPKAIDDDEAKPVLWSARTALSAPAPVVAPRPPELPAAPAMARPIAAPVIPPVISLTRIDRPKIRPRAVAIAAGGILLAVTVGVGSQGRAGDQQADEAWARIPPAPRPGGF